MRVQTGFVEACRTLTEVTYSHKCFSAASTICSACMATITVEVAGLAVVCQWVCELGVGTSHTLLIFVKVKTFWAGLSGLIVEY